MTCRVAPCEQQGATKNPPQQAENDCCKKEIEQRNATREKKLPSLAYCPRTASCCPGILVMTNVCSFGTGMNSPCSPGFAKRSFKLKTTSDLDVADLNERQRRTSGSEVQIFAGVKDSNVSAVFRLSRLKHVKDSRLTFGLTVFTTANQHYLLVSQLCQNQQGRAVRT